MEARAFLDFLHIAEKLKCNTRHSYTSSGRRESVAEHSWRLCMMAYFMKDEFPDTDIDRVILMCIFHDLGEAVTGDIPAFEKTGADEEKESAVTDGLAEELPSPYREELKALFREMEERSTKEAKLYKALDKLEALIQHNEAELSTWLPLEYDLQMTYGNVECDFSGYTRRLRDLVREDSGQKIASGGDTAVRGRAVEGEAAWRYRCPCCENEGKAGEPGGRYEICKICGWENDPVQEREPDYRGGANRMSLNEAREAYKKRRGQSK